MKALRILLQFVIVAAGGFMLAALISLPDTDITSIFVFPVFLAFLLALTLALKEETEKRLVPGHKLSFKPMGIALLLLGVFCIFNGASYLFGSQPLPSGAGRCRAICGLILLASQSLDESVVRVFAFGLWSSAGLFLGFVGYKMQDIKAA